MKETITLQLQQYTEVWRENNVVYEEWAKRKGLSYFELLTLLSLVEAKEDCTQTDICKQWLFPKQTVHCILKTLKKRNGSFCFHWKGTVETKGFFLPHREKLLRKK